MSEFVYVDFTTNQVTVIITEDGYEPCWICNGEGTVEDDFYGDGSEITCQECDGAGVTKTAN